MLPKKGTIAGNLVATELKAIVVAVGEVLTTLKVVSPITSATTTEVQAIAGIIFAIVFEVRTTVKAILSPLGVCKYLILCHKEVAML